MPSQTPLENLAAGFASLGRLHRDPPSQHVLDAVRELLDDWPLPDTEAAARGIDSWRRSAAAAEDAELVRTDHDRLYGAAAEALVAPYESVHRGADGLVFDRYTLDVRQAYARLGLVAPALNREPDDHIGLEFDFVAQALLQLLETGDAAIAETVRAFLHDHLLVWAPDLLSAVEQRADTDFMRGLAQLSQGALQSARASFD
ncbi:MAG: molecular chaperone TorD family protein [Micropruina sp.]|nr:molecular chaperone TorD family protein [Micropruina sp.]